MLEGLKKLGEFIGRAADVARGARPVQVLNSGEDGVAVVAVQGATGGHEIKTLVLDARRIKKTHIQEESVETLDDFVTRVNEEAENGAVQVVRLNSSGDSLLAAPRRDDEPESVRIKHDLLPGEHRTFFNQFALENATHVVLLETFRHVRHTLEDQQAWKDLETVESGTSIKSMAQGPMGYVVTVQLSGGIESQRQIPQRLVFNLNLYEETEKVPVEVLLSAQLKGGQVVFTTRVNTSKLTLSKNEVVRSRLKGLSDGLDVCSGKFSAEAFYKQTVFKESEKAPF